MAIDSRSGGEPSLWERFQSARTEYELRRVGGECFARLYWHDRHTQLLAEGKHTREQLFGLEDEEDLPRYQYLASICAYRMAHDMTEPELNSRGNQVIRRRGEDFNADSRYKFDGELCKSKDGWRQYDTRQDASYFGVWVHIEKRETLTYCEGDVTIVRCPDNEHLQAELDDMARCYGPVPPYMIACSDIGYENGRIAPKGHIEAYYDPRPTIPA